MGKILKVALRLVPPIARVQLARVLQHGAQKHGGPFDWRDRCVSINDYVDAAQRHLLAYEAGQDLDADSGLHQLAHVMACCAIILDAQHTGAIVDDRHKTNAIDLTIS